jgi:hypothetical protein
VLLFAEYFKTNYHQPRATWARKFGKLVRTAVHRKLRRIQRNTMRIKMMRVLEAMVWL